MVKWSWLMSIFSKNTNEGARGQIMSWESNSVRGFGAVWQTRNKYKICTLFGPIYGSKSRIANAQIWNPGFGFV